MRLTHCLLAVALCGAASPACAQTVTTIVNNGDPGNRIDLVVLSEGYTASQLAKFNTDAQTFIGTFLGTELYQDYSSYFNVRTVAVASNQSGADHPELSPPVLVDTAFDATYNCSGVTRLICVDYNKVHAAVDPLLPAVQRDYILVLVNDTTYGGSGGSVLVSSTHAQAVEIILHEFGHTHGLLADEYGTQPPPCVMGEPDAANATRATTRADIKWNAWIDAATPIPTLGTALGVPGLYEGADYCPTGKFRPTYNSKMRSLGFPYEQVNTEQMVRRFYNFVSPIDGVSPSDANVAAPRGSRPTFTVTPLLPLQHALDIAWRVDANPSATGISFSLDTAALSTGAHTVMATVRDATSKVRSDPANLLVDSMTWNVTVAGAAQAAVLSATVAHRGNFTRGQSGASYTVTVANAPGAGATSGTVTVTDTLPSGLSLVSMSGPGWTCAANSCTSSDAVMGGASYPPITVNVNVSADAAGQVSNQASVSGGGSATASASDPTNIDAPFGDVPPASVFFNAIHLMREYGITTGCGSGTYCPDDNVTRAQMAVFIVRAVYGGDTFTSSDVPYFADVPASAFGFRWIQKMFELGVTTGCGGGNYCPGDPVTRAQMAVFITRSRLGAAADSTFTFPAAAQFTDVPIANPYFKWIQRMKADLITSGCGGDTYCPDDPVTRAQMAVFIMRGDFNLLLPPATPLLVYAAPALAPLGQTTTVTLSGINTSFAQGVTQVSAGPNITAGSVTVANATSLTVQLTVAANAAAGPRTLLVKSGAEEAVLPNGLMVQ